MRNYLLRRLALIPFMLLAASFLLFWLLLSRPGNAAILRVGSTGTCDECVANLEKELGLDRPFLVQYGDWLGKAVRGDFGKSLDDDRPILPRIRKALPVTLELGLMTMALAGVIGVSVGIISALRPNSILDAVLRVLSILGLSIPGFWLATLLILLPEIWWGWTPLRPKWVGITVDPIENLRVVFWPALVLSIASSAYLARVVRSTMLETLHSDHVRTARAKGLAETTVIIRHAFRSSLVTVVTIIGLQFGTVLGGSVVMESIFGIPGIGTITLAAVNGQDFPVVLATTMFFAIAFLLISIIIDMMYAVVDPRVRY